MFFVVLITETFLILKREEADIGKLQNSPVDTPPLGILLVFAL